MAMRESPSEHKPASLDHLSARELEILRRTSNGATNNEISEELGVTVHAVKFHLASVYRKLGVANRTEAAVAYVNANSSPAGAGAGRD
jgi:DNA-binding CsgD family transcriptional regulator